MRILLPPFVLMVLLFGCLQDSERARLELTACDHAWIDRLELLPPDPAPADACTSFWQRIQAGGQTYYLLGNHCADLVPLYFTCDEVDTYPDTRTGELRTSLPSSVWNTEQQREIIGHFPE